MFKMNAFRKWTAAGMAVSVMMTLNGIFPDAVRADSVRRIQLTSNSIRNNSATSTTFNLKWNPTSNGDLRFLYEWSPGGRKTLLFDGNATSPVTLTRDRAGTWRYQVLFGRRNGRGRIQVTGQSGVITLAVPTPQPPTLIPPPRPPLDSGFRLQWTNDPGDFVYELVEDTSPRFLKASLARYWPRTNEQNIPPRQSGITYYRVRSWTAMPADGGKASGWSNVIAVRVLSDPEFLDFVARKCFDYLVDTTRSNGLTLDRLATDGTPGAMMSIAAGGFYLSALTIGAERGWITREAAAAHAKTALETFKSVTPNVRGFFYHFLKPDGSPFSDLIEVSSIDTAILITGALQAGEYFGGEVKTLADFIYRRVEWNWMFDAGLNLLRQAWTAKNGFQSYYNSYNETMMLYLLAIGSPSYPIPPDSFYTFARPKGSYNGPDMIFNSGGRIFTYQYSHAWFDFRNTTDELGVNWWRNSIEGVKANQRYAMDNPSYGYNQYVWGLTACDGPDGYKAYGARPAYSNFHDGTIAPTGVGGSIALAPDIALPSLKYLYLVHGDKIWRNYGFVDSFNLSRNWVDNYFLGIDQGIILLMLENLKSQLIWRTFMKNEHAIRSLQRTGFSGFAPPRTGVTLDDFEDGNFWTPDTSLGWWDVDGTTVYRRSEARDPSRSGWKSMKVEYTKTGLAWSFFAGNISTANPRKDFTPYTKLVVWIYGKADIMVKLQDRASREAELGTGQAVNPTGWTRLVFDYSGLKSLDLADIQNILFFVDPGNPSSSGTLYADDIRLE